MSKWKKFSLQCLHFKRMPNNARTTWKCPACKSSFKQIVKPLIQGNNQGEVICTGTSFGDTERSASLCNLTNRHYQLILSPIDWLDGHAYTLLRAIHPTMKGLQRSTLGPCRNFGQVSGQFNQILHTGNQHWVCVNTVRSDDGLVDSSAFGTSLPSVFCITNITLTN